MSRTVNNQKSGANTASRQIAEDLIRRIIQEEYHSGDKLPTERELALEFGVNRHVVREALTRLEAIGLVSIRQGSGIYVQDLRLTGGLELFEMMLEDPHGGINKQFLQDALEFRDAIFRNVVKLAAKNRTEQDLEEFRKAIKGRRDAIGDNAKVAWMDFQLLKLLSVAAHNQVYTLVFNTMNKFIPKMHSITTWDRLDQEAVQLINERIGEAIEHREPEMADLLAARLLDMIRRAALAEIE